MKKYFMFFVLLTLLSLSNLLVAQTPNGFNYQAVARNSSGTVLTNQAVGLRITILQGSESGTSVYSESHTTTSGNYGVLNLVIGNGTQLSGDFTAINWGSSTYFIKVEMDGTGGTNYQLMGTSQLLSVPYALHSKTADNGFSGNYSDLTNTPTIPTNISQLSNDAGYITTEVDGSVTNELQALSISNDTIYLSNGGFAKLPDGFSGDYNALTNKPVIPANVSELTNDAGYLNSFTEVDGSLTNELQALSISDDTIYLSNGGFAKLPAGFSGDYNALINTPVLFDGNYNSLTNQPSLFDGSWTSLTGKPTFATVATSGSYADLLDLPTIFDGNYNNLTNQPTLFSGAYTDLTGKPILWDSTWASIKNKPVFFDCDYNSLSNKPTLFDGTWTNLTGKPTFATVATSGSYNDLSNLPTIPTNVSELANDAGYITGSGAGYTIQFQSNLSVSPADNSSYYIGATESSTNYQTSNMNAHRIYIPKTGVIKACNIYVKSFGVASSETNTFSLNINGTTNLLISNTIITDGTCAGSCPHENAVLNQQINAGDFLLIKWQTPTWVTNPSSVSISAIVYIE